MSFPEGFTWGVAAAAYQIEGAHDADGKGPSVWDALCRRPGAVFQGESGDLACDHYHRFPEDVALMRQLGVHAYRMSISWPRLLPDGTGAPNPAGIDFYDRLIDALLEAGIHPWVTLFHWDEPVATFRRGGWLNRDMVEWFGEYAALVARHFSDRVTHWMTLNEPQCFLGFGHADGGHAPGVAHDRDEVLLATHHALMAHGRAVQALRAGAKSPPTIGWAPVGITFIPASESPDDIEAARRLTFSCPPPSADVTSQYYFNNAWYSDPVCLGEYPHEGVAHFGRDMPAIQGGDMELINQPLDFYGCNIYFGSAPVTAGEPPAPAPIRAVGHPRTMMGWPVTPDALYWGPRFFAERYGLPIYITENGCAGMDWVHADGCVHDTHRIDLLTRYLCALRRAAREGIDVRGYFQWSIMDNFEWSEGYAKRFGLIYIDYETQERIPKDSYEFYREVIETHGASLPGSLAPIR
ncbi:MAG: GH1 family beta-glucosidase [Planctomycetota bacterium]